MHRYHTAFGLLSLFAAAPAFAQLASTPLVNPAIHTWKVTAAA